MSNIVDTVEDKIENSILTSIDSIVALKKELAIRSKTRLLDEMRQVSRRAQNVENT